jgi:hypothetical protein
MIIDLGGGGGGGNLICAKHKVINMSLSSRLSSKTMPIKIKSTSEAHSHTILCDIKCRTISCTMHNTMCLYDG